MTSKDKYIETVDLSVKDVASKSVKPDEDQLTTNKLTNNTEIEERKLWEKF